MGKKPVHGKQEAHKGNSVQDMAIAHERNRAMNAEKFHFSFLSLDYFAFALSGSGRQI